MMARQGVVIWEVRDAGVSHRSGGVWTFGQRRLRKTAETVQKAITREKKAASQ
jgi:hypothetical protein